jgi:hypothetical protein
MTEVRIAALAMTAFALGLVAGGMLLGEAFGALGDDDHVFVEHYASGSRRVGDIIGGALHIAAGAAFLVFTAAMRRACAPGLAADVFVIAGSAFGILLIVSAALFAATPLSMSFGRMFDDRAQFDGFHAAVLPQAGTAVFLLGALPVAALAIGSLAPGAREELPRWHRSVSFTCAAVLPFAFLYFPMLALPLWAGATAVALWRAPQDARG